MTDQDMSPLPDTNKKPGSEEVLNALEIGKEILEEFSNKFRATFKIAGKTIPEWRQEMKVVLPPNPTPGSICTLSAEVSNKYQVAQYMFAVFEAQLDALENGASKEHSDKYSSLVAEYENTNRKLPAADTLKALVASHTQDLVSAKVNAKICRDFFKKTVDSLKETRESINACLWASQIELKLNPISIRNQDNAQTY